MKIVDLTKALVADMRVWPGDPAVTVKVHRSIKEQGYCVTAVSFGSHSATHIDGPAHLIEGGKRIDEYPPERFFARCYVVAKGRQPAVEVADVENFPQECNGVLFAGDDTYLSLVAAKALLDRGVYLFGFSSLSCDPMDSTTFDVHHLLLGQEATLIENLASLDALAGKIVEVVALPILVAGADSAPARVIAQF